jgi:hypothetical protein
MLRKDLQELGSLRGVPVAFQDHVQRTIDAVAPTPGSAEPTARFGDTWQVSTAGATDAGSAPSTARAPTPPPSTPQPSTPTPSSQTPPSSAAPVDPAALYEELRRTQARYETLQGKYDAEIRALRAALEAQAAALAPATPPSPPPAVAAAAAAAQPSSLETPPPDREQLVAALKQRYGQMFEDDVLQLVADAAALAEQQAIQRATQQVEMRLTPLQNELSSVRVRAVESQLDTTIPEWRRVVQDPGFSAWLDTPDPLTRVRRRDVMLQAVQAADAAWVGQIVQAYANATAPASPPAPSPPPPPPPAPSASPAAPASPSYAGPSMPVAPAAPPAPRGQIAVQPVRNVGVVRPADLAQLQHLAARPSVDPRLLDQQLLEMHRAIQEGRFTRG